MSNTLLTLGLVNAGTKVAQGYQQGVDYKEKRDLSRAEAKYRKAKMDAELRQMNFAQQQGLMEQQVAQALATSRAATNKLMKLESYNFFDAYAEDDDPKHLNNAIHSIPVLKGLLEMGFGGPIAAVQKLNLNDSNDLRLLSQEESIDPVEFDAKEGKLNLDNVGARYLKVIGTDGRQRILDVADDLYASTGYFNYKSQQSQANILAKMKIARELRGPSPGELEKNSVFAAQTLPEETLQTATRKLFRDKTIGNVAGQMQEAQVVEDKIVSAVGIDPTKAGKLGEFLSIDMTDPKNKEKLTTLAPTLERLTQESLNSAQKRDYERITAGISSAQAAAGLKEPSTGFVDAPLNNIRDYIDANLKQDSVEQKQARNAYFSLRNTLRNAISGASLTDAEIAAFNDAFGTLRQQLPSVLSGLVVQLRQTKNQLDGMAQSGNPYAMHYRLGGTRQNLQEVINIIDTRLADLGTEEAQIQDILGTPKQ